MPEIILTPTTELTAPVQRGYGDPKCQRQTGRLSPTNGWTFDQEFRGLDFVLMQNLATVYGNIGVEYELTLQNGIAMLKTTDTTGNITIDIWEITANRVNVSWLKNPILNNQLYELAELYLASQSGSEATDQNVLDWNVTRFIGLMAAGVAAGSPPFDWGANPATDPPNSADLLSGSVFSPKNFFDGIFSFDDVDPAIWQPIIRAYQRALAGSDSYQSDTYTLRHTTNASNRGFTNVADDNVNCLYTLAQFFTEIGNPSFWVFPAPNEIIGALTTIFNTLIPTPANYLASALKSGSSRVTAANNRVNITTEYEIFNWSTDDYNLA